DAAARLVQDLAHRDRLGGDVVVDGVELVRVHTRSTRRTTTSSPASFWIAFRISALIGSMWVPSPSAMNQLRNGWPSTVPRAFPSPRVPKYSAEPGITTYVQPPFWPLCRSVDVNSLSSWVMNSILPSESRTMSPSVAPDRQWYDGTRW